LYLASFRSNIIILIPQFDNSATGESQLSSDPSARRVGNESTFSFSLFICGSHSILRVFRDLPRTAARRRPIKEGRKEKIRKAGERGKRVHVRVRVSTRLLSCTCWRVREDERKRKRESIDPTLPPGAGTPSWPNFTPPSFHPLVVVCCIPICLIFSFHSFSLSMSVLFSLFSLPLSSSFHPPISRG